MREAGIPAGQHIPRARDRSPFWGGSRASTRPIAVSDDVERRHHGPSSHVLRTASTALVAVALLVPAVGRSDADHNGPNPPTAVAVVAASSTSLTMTWEAGRGRPAQEFALLRDGKRLALTAETSYTFTGLSCGTTYTLGIEALDSAGNRSDLVSIFAARGCVSATGADSTSSPPSGSGAARVFCPAAARTVSASVSAARPHSRQCAGSRAPRHASRAGHAICQDVMGRSRSLRLA